MLSRLKMALRGLFRRSQAEHELDEERKPTSPCPSVSRRNVSGCAAETREPTSSRV
jgi:hypothetical protein